MPRSLHRRPTPGRRIAAAATAVLLTAASLAAFGLSSAPATATTTVTPTEAGSPHPVVRDASVNIDVDRVGMTYHRNSSSGSFTAQSPLAVALGLTACRGNNSAGTNLSPRSVLTVTRPDATVLHTQTSPVRDLGLGGFLTNPPNGPSNPQPAAANSNYLGDFPGATYHGMKATLDLTGQPAGVYTVTTTTTNMVKTGFGACAVGSPGPLNSVLPGPVVESQTFEYRPWQATFKDVFGNGNVNVNVTPREHKWSIRDKNSAIYQGTPVTQQYYSFGGQFLLPSDPAACAVLVTSCLPSGAIACEPSSGCVPRLMILNQPAPTTDPTPDGMFGIFDLETKAFIALVTLDGSTRLLTSLGTDLDATYKGLLQQLSEAAAAQGIDLATLLATEVIIRDGSVQQTSLSLLNGLQLDPSDKPWGIHLSSASTVQAGVILDIYSSLRLTGGGCLANSSSSTAAQDRFTRNEPDGYTVTKTDLLPKVPSVGPLGVIVGGPVYHIMGKFKSAAEGALVNTASALIGVDTATDSPNGYPVWVEPFLTAGHTTTAKTMDFLGTATWSASESPVGAGCLVVDFMLGTGVAVFNNPLPVGLGTLIDLVGQPNPDAAALTAAVDTALTDAAGSLASLPVVDTVLATILGALPAI